jgi:ligand-binding SRPBCC domain-containing protein
VKQLVATPTIAAPAERVWRLLTDVEALAAWAPSIRPARLDDPSVGLAAHATGTVTAIARLTLRVVVTEYIDGRSWAWSLGGCRQPATMLRTTTGAVAPRSAFPWLLRRTWRSAVSPYAGSSASPPPSDPGRPSPLKRRTTCGL